MKQEPGLLIEASKNIEIAADLIKEESLSSVINPNLDIKTALIFLERAKHALEQYLKY